MSDFSLWEWINSHPKRYVKIVVDKERNQKYVELHDPLFVGKTFKIQPVYSLDYPDNDIIKESTPELMHRFGYRKHSFWGH